MRRKNYQKKYRRREDKKCPGCNEPITDKAHLCRKCTQLALKNKLVRQERTGSGATIFKRYNYRTKTWGIMGFDRMEADKVIQELIQQQNLIIRRNDEGDIIQVDKVMRYGEYVDVERIRWNE